MINKRNNTKRGVGGVFVHFSTCTVYYKAAAEVLLLLLQMAFSLKNVCTSKQDENTFFFRLPADKNQQSWFKFYLKYCLTVGLDNI